MEVTFAIRGKSFTEEELNYLKVKTSLPIEWPFALLPSKGDTIEIVELLGLEDAPKGLIEKLENMHLEVAYKSWVLNNGHQFIFIVLIESEE